MVLIRIGWLCVLACAACSESLFDDHGPDNTKPVTCDAPCVADAALDFNGSATGKNQIWRYLDDHRDLTWAAMATSSTKMTGADPANHITTCAANPGAAACAMVPDAVLLSSSGATSAADPAIEFTAPAKQVLQLTLKAFIASGDNQTIRLYRNGRPDALFTGVAVAGKLLDQTITVDAVAKDRFLVAMAPMTAGASDVAIQFRATSADALFPQDCLLAVGFADATGNMVSDLCKGATLTYTDDADKATPVVLGDDPFGQTSAAATVSLGTYFQSDQPIPQNTTLTVQLWIRQRAVAPTSDFAWVFSDMDLTNFAPGGLAIGVGDMLQASTGTVATPQTVDTADVLTPWPGTGAWHFVRVVQTGGNLNLCLDGTQKGNVTVPDGQLKTRFPLWLGRNRFGLPNNESFFDGSLDDLRIFKGALPCE